MDISLVLASILLSFEALWISINAIIEKEFIRL